jgi:cytidylate kinase
VAIRHNVSTSDNSSLVPLARNMDIQFKTVNESDIKILLEGEDVSVELRTEETAALASQVAAHPEVRDALLVRQQRFAKSPGLVADGRDMGTVVFPDAQLKLYLTASIEERARRRYKQLLDKGESVSLRALESQVRARDERDTNREVSPLVAADDAIEIDTSELSIDEVLNEVLNIALLKGLM